MTLPKELKTTIEKELDQLDAKEYNGVMFFAEGFKGTTLISTDGDPKEFCGMLVNLLAQFADDHDMSQDEMLQMLNGTYQNFSQSAKALHTLLSDLSKALGGDDDD